MRQGGGDDPGKPGEKPEESREKAGPIPVNTGLGDGDFLTAIVAALVGANTHDGEGTFRQVDRRGARAGSGHVRMDVADEDPYVATQKISTQFSLPDQSTDGGGMATHNDCCFLHRHVLGPNGTNGRAPKRTGDRICQGRNELRDQDRYGVGNARAHQVPHYLCEQPEILVDWAIAGAALASHGGSPFQAPTPETPGL